jgi:hypothetical protein
VRARQQQQQCCARTAASAMLMLQHPESPQGAGHLINSFLLVSCTAKCLASILHVHMPSCCGYVPLCMHAACSWRYRGSTDKFPALQMSCRMTNPRQRQLVNQSVRTVLVPASTLNNCPAGTKLGQPFPAARTLKVGAQQHQQELQTAQHHIVSAAWAHYSTLLRSCACL